MSKEENIKIVKLFIEEIVNKKRIEIIEEIFHPEFDTYVQNISETDRVVSNSSFQWFTFKEPQFLESKDQVEFTQTLIQIYKDAMPDFNYEI